VCDKRRTFSWSVPPPGATAARHLLRCRQALWHIVLTPGSYCVPIQSDISKRELRTRVLRASSRSALAMLLAAVLMHTFTIWWDSRDLVCTHQVEGSDTTSRAAERYLNYCKSFVSFTFKGQGVRCLSNLYLPWMGAKENGKNGRIRIRRARYPMHA
jgi:hypothetical protein